MLGIVGPRDSVTLAQQVASAGRSADLIGWRTATSPRPSTWHERSSSCATWCCSPASCRISKLDGPGRGAATSIGAALGGRSLPDDRADPQGDRWAVPFSIDSFDAATVRQVFADMGLEHPGTIIPVVDEDGALVFEDAEATLVRISLRSSAATPTWRSPVLPVPIACWPTPGWTPGASTTPG